MWRLCEDLREGAKDNTICLLRAYFISKLLERLSNTENET